MKVIEAAVLYKDPDVWLLCIALRGPGDYDIDRLITYNNTTNQMTLAFISLTNKVKNILMHKKITNVL